MNKRTSTDSTAARPGRHLTAAFRNWLALLLLAAWLPGVAAQDAVLPPPTGEVLLEIHGAERVTSGHDHARLDARLLASLPRYERRTHTSVTDGPQQFSGYRLLDVLELVKARGQRLRASALNAYAVELDVAELERYEVLLADHMNGQPLQSGDKGPFWLIYPRDQYSELQDIRYDYRWVWQLIRLEML